MRGIRGAGVSEYQEGGLSERAKQGARILREISEWSVGRQVDVERSQESTADRYGSHHTRNDNYANLDGID